MSKKPGYTLEQHQKLGRELYEMKNRLSDIGAKLGKAYPFKLSDQVTKITKALDSLRSDLDEKVCEENRDFKEATHVYFPGSPPRS